MSERYPGGVITKNPATPTGPFESGAAPGIWTLDQQLQYQQQGIWPTAGLQPNYIEDVFSTYLYTGTGAAQTITNGIDLSTKGGLVWVKSRSAVYDHLLFDTARGTGNFLSSNLTSSASTSASTLTAFNTTGFSLGNDAGGWGSNISAVTTASWTFRKQPKFFDVVTYTGNGLGEGQTISHNLGTAPAFIISKRTNGTGAWAVLARTGAGTYATGLSLNSTGAAIYSGAIGDAPTSTTFNPTSFYGNDGNYPNASGGTYVAYLFAHDAGGFGLAGTDNVISCGSFTTNASGEATVNLGYEPQWVMYKPVSLANSWNIIDTMRGYSVGGTYDPFLRANAADAEYTSVDLGYPTATGFYATVDGSATCIYIAIRRGPMKVPTDATKVFLPSTYVGSNSVNQVINTGFTVDMTWARARNASVSMEDYDRLRGNTVRLSTDTTAAEVSATALYFDLSNSVSLRAGYNLNYSTLDFINYTFGRAPSFFDEVCYTGDGTTSRNVTHNLTVQPELVIVKSRSNGSTNWVTGVYANTTQSNLWLNSTAADGSASSGGIIYTQFSTSSSFRLSAIGGVVTDINTTSATYVAYLFATCPGVSKVGSYTGNGTTQTIACGFTGGARFVLLKRTDSTGDWYVYDTARGMTTLTDPYLFLNSTAAEVATLGSVTTVSTGFALNSSVLAAINVNAGTYIFLAIA
jgi:hypothetical protein